MVAAAEAAETLAVKSRHLGLFCLQWQFHQMTLGKRRRAGPRKTFSRGSRRPRSEEEYRVCHSAGCFVREQREQAEQGKSDAVPVLKSAEIRYFGIKISGSFYGC